MCNSGRWIVYPQNLLITMFCRICFFICKWNWVANQFIPRKFHYGKYLPIIITKRNDIHLILKSLDTVYPGISVSMLI